MSNIESKGRAAWYDKFYRKLETILVEVDTLASQVSSESSDPSGLDSVRDTPQDHCPGTFDMIHRVDLPICKSPSEISRSVHLEEGDRLKEKLSDFKLTDDKMLSISSLSEERSDCNQTGATSICREQPISSQGSHCSPESFLAAVECNDDTFVSPSGIPTGGSNLISFPAEIRATPAKDNVANIRAFTSNSVTVSQDVFLIEDFDAPLDTIDLYDMTIREDSSDFDDNLLYAARDRTRQLRSFKRKVMDALTSKRRREKEYEQLAIWFGDADMGSDLINTKEHATTTSLDSKSSQSNVPFSSEDSEWELL